VNELPSLKEFEELGRMELVEEEPEPLSASEPASEPEPEQAPTPDVPAENA
jgi:hypothetical protein